MIAAQLRAIAPVARFCGRGGGVGGGLASADVVVRGAAFHGECGRAEEQTRVVGFWLSSPKSYPTGPRRRNLGSLSCWTSSGGTQPLVEAKRRNSQTEVRIALAVLLDRNRGLQLGPRRSSGSALEAG